MGCFGRNGDRERGFTLMEVLVVVVILGVLSSVALRAVQNGIESSRIKETQNEMLNLAHAVAGNPDLYANGLRSDFGYIGDVGTLPGSLDNLITNPGSFTTWNGPYVGGRFAEDADGFKKDAWGNLYAFSGGITISSTGGGSTPLTTSVAATATDLTSTTVAGTITDAVGNPPGDSAAAVSIIITYPDGSGSTTTSSTNPSSGGSFSFTGIPIGLHSVQAIYSATDDTVTAFASVLPRNGASVSLRLPGNPFAASEGGGGGGGGGSAWIEYAPGTAQTTGTADNNIEFYVYNAGTTSILIDNLIAQYSLPAYFRYIRWDGTIVFNETTPRAGSGDTCIFSITKVLAIGATARLQLQQFKNAPIGGSNADVSDSEFTFTFSDGSTITFNSGP
jgi:prepilin-type N-terminal cleavage/methylation domain-containing protein